MKVFFSKVRLRFPREFYASWQLSKQSLPVRLAKDVNKRMNQILRDILLCVIFNRERVMTKVTWPTCLYFLLLWFSYCKNFAWDHPYYLQSNLTWSNLSLYIVGGFSKAVSHCLCSSWWIFCTWCHTLHRYHHSDIWTSVNIDINHEAKTT